VRVGLVIGSRDRQGKHLFNSMVASLSACVLANSKIFLSVGFPVIDSPAITTEDVRVSENLRGALQKCMVAM
jgi:hypothetical protein